MKIVSINNKKYLMCAHGQTTHLPEDCEITVSGLCDAIIRCQDRYYFVTHYKGDFIYVPVPQEIAQKITRRDNTVIDDILSSTELYEHEKKLLLRFVKLILG